MSSQPDPPVAGPVVNMRELAVRLRTTRQSLSVWLDRWPDFPVVRRGTNGTPFQFDAAAVFAFLAAKREEQKSSQVAKDAALAQLVFPFEDLDQPAPAGLSSAEQIAAVKLRQMLRKEAEEAGRLTSSADVASHLATLFSVWNRQLHTAIRSACRDLNLPEPVQRALDAKLSEAQREFVRGAHHLMAPPPEAHTAHA